MLLLTLTALSFLALTNAHDQHHFSSSAANPDLARFPYHQPPYLSPGGVTADSVFSGITTFARLPWVHCLSPAVANTEEGKFDIGFIGAPFDTGTSYRPGARFGPSGIRAGSRRLNLYGGWNVPLSVDPFRSLKVVDCGDIPVTPYDNTYAINQIESGHHSLLSRSSFTSSSSLFPPASNSTSDSTDSEEEFEHLALDNTSHPRIITLGGDHTIVLPLLRSVNKVYGPVSVVHFDSHLDTWKPSVFGGAPTDVAAINHGTYFWHASNEGLIRNGSSIHGAIRTTLSGLEDYANDDASGFTRIEAREIDTIGVDGIVKKIRETVGDRPMYLSIDIDSIDPAFAPATGTPETGGWSTRELRAILRGLDGWSPPVQIVSADIVEVAPAYDTNAELTTMAAADVLFEVISVMAKNPLGKMKVKGNAD